MTDTSDSDMVKNGKDGQKDLLTAGSTALLENSPLVAISKYKSVLDKITCKSSQKTSISHLVLRYALCIAYLKSNDFTNICEAGETLMDMIDSGYASKLPALYLAIAKVFYALNRFSSALEFIEKGLKAIHNNSKIKQQSWPGLQKPIDETGKDSLNKELLNLQSKCKNVQPPDSICQYEKCLEYSTHIIPAREIYFSDLDFAPFYYLQCDANCKFAYHDLCWEHLKNSDINLKQPQDLLGKACPADSCTSSVNNNSVIVEVNLIGSDGFNKPLNSWGGIKNSNCNSRHTSPEQNHSSTKQGSTNGSSVKSSESRSLLETSLEVRSPNIVAPRWQDFKPASAYTKNYAVSCNNLTPVEKKIASVPMHYSYAPPYPQQSMSYGGFPLLQPPAFIRAQNNFRRPIPVPAPMQFLPRAQASPVFYPLGIPQRPQFVVGPPQNYGFYSTTPPRPAAICVDINQNFSKAGVMQTGRHENFTQQVSGRHPRPFSPVVREIKEDKVESVTEPETKSEVDAVKRVVKNLAGEDSPWKKKISSPNTSSVVKEVTVKQVVQDFQRLVHDLAENDSIIQGGTLNKPPCEKDSVSVDCSDSLKSTESQSVLPVSSNSTSPIARHFKELVYDLARQDNTQDSKFPPKSADIKCSPSKFITSTPAGEAYNITESLSSKSACLVGTLSLHSFHSLKPFRTLSDRFTTQSSTFQAKPKNSLKDEETSFDQSVLLSSSIANSLCSSEDDVRSEASDSSKFSALVDTLSKCRAMKFGYSDEEFRSPQSQCFGRPFEEFTSYLQPDEIDVADKDTAEFLFSLYQSMFDKNGHYKIEDLQETWKTTVSDLGISETFTDKYKSVSEFLLKSERFAAIDDLIGTSDLLPDMFLKAEVVITESVEYLLFSQVGNPRSKDIHSGSGNDAWKTKANNNNCDSDTRVSSSRNVDDLQRIFKGSSDKFVRSSTAQPVNKDKNDNPICRVSSANSNNKQLKLTPSFNGSANPTSTTFVPKDSTVSSQEGEVYLSEEDDEEDKRNCLFIEEDDGTLVSGPCNKTKREGMGKPVVTHQHTQTDEVTDMEKENLTVQKENLLQDITGLEYEKTELLRRIETLQSELDHSRADLELKHAISTKQLQDFQNSLQKKSEEFIEIKEKNITLELQVNELHELIKEKDVQVSELDTTLDKLRRIHAKEINNFGQRFREDRKLKEEEFQTQLELKDQKYILLWKDYCEFKIKKFNHLCNDRINVLSQLKDMMSDSMRPTKSDIKSLIETYEEEMISVSPLNNEVNEACKQELEKLSKDINYRPSVIDVPDLMKFVYPPEGAFEYLHNILKSKQDDFAPSRNHFSPAVSRFPRSYASNGLQSSSQTREAEPFSSMANTSIFGQGLNETSHLWHNSFSAPSVHSAPLSFDVGNSNGSHLPLHQGYGAASSMMSPQPGINLMSSMLPFPPSASANTSHHTMMGSARSTPSPLLSFPSVNGMAFNSNTAAGSAVGSKVPSLGAIQKPVGNSAPPPNPVSKTIIPAVLTPASTVAPPQVSSPQGAVSKPKVPTATAAMTPIVPSKPPVRLIAKGLKTNESNYEKLMRNLQKMFPTRNDGDLTQALKMARLRNGGTLSSLTHSEIVSKVDEILSKQSKQTAMGWEKFGQAAWGTAAKTSVVEWEGSKDDLDECCICMTALNSQEVYTLECKHAFHKECIRKWLLQDGVCPMCRVHSTMLDEFPPLG